MPVVDAYAGLSDRSTSVSDYLAGSVQTHVLRMIAVQSVSQEATQLGSPIEKSLVQIKQLQTQSTTPGLGGFPNVIIALCNLYDKDAVSQLLNRNGVEKLRGIHHVFDAMPVERSRSNENQSALNASLQMLLKNNLVLDLTATHDHFETILSWAQAYPSLPMVVNVSLTSVKSECSSEEHYLEQLGTLSSSPNIHIKYQGAGMVAAEVEPALAKALDVALADFGDKRIMLGSGQFNSSTTEESELVSFDQLWQAYMKRCETVSSSARDNLLRSNAMRFYDM